MNNVKLADLHAATSFLNSLLKEWSNYIIYRDDSDLSILIELCDQRYLKIPIRNYSLLGRHDYVGTFYLVKNNVRKEINFNELISHLCEKISILNRICLEQFKSNVITSRNNIEEALRVYQPLNESNSNFINAEQALVLGHHFHPIPKHRDKLIDNELYTYAPDFKNEFALQWLFVHEDILHHRRANNFNDQDWLLNLFIADCIADTPTIPNKMHPIPMHPWQWQYLQKNPTIMAYVKNKKIISVKLQSMPWQATSSLRTVYNRNSEYMLKFSLHLKLTNSIRVLLKSEVARGILLHDVLQTLSGQVFGREHQEFHIITEPAYLCLIDHNGDLIEDSMVVCRLNPFKGEATKDKYMLATLIQADPLARENLLLSKIKNSSLQHLSANERVTKWFNDFLRIAIKPFFHAYTKYGIIMEGHPQNIVLGLKDGFPAAAYFRDCQDHAYSDHGYQLFNAQMELTENCVANREIGCHYFIYQVIVNSVFNVITTLAKSDLVKEECLLNSLHKFLLDLQKEDHPDPFCLDVALSNQELLHKCNFRFAMTQVNDNQLPGSPLDFYIPIKNEIRTSALRMTLNATQYILYQYYLPQTRDIITLRLFDIKRDMEQFVTWQQKPRVAKYWQLTSQENARRYIEALSNDCFTQMIIIEKNHQAIGYAELYWTAYDVISKYYNYGNDDRGFHLLIGEDSFLGVKNTTSVFKAIMHYLFLSSDKTKRIIVEPDKNNHRFIKYMQLIPGWQFITEAALPDKIAAIYMFAQDSTYRLSEVDYGF